MSAKSSFLGQQHHKSVQELVKEGKISREQDRQKAIFNDVITPFLATQTKNMHEAEELVFKAKIALESAYKALIMDKQKEVSETIIDQLDLFERMEKVNLKNELVFAELFKGESLAKTCAMIDAFIEWIRLSRNKQDKNRSINEFPFSDLV